MTAAPLEAGETYQLVVLRDVGLPLAQCLFEYGEPVASAPDVIASASQASDSGAGVGADATSR